MFLIKKCCEHGKSRWAREISKGQILVFFLSNNNSF